MSSRHIHLDALGGIAGDMFVAALLDAFPELRQRVLSDVAAVIPEAIGRAALDEGTSGGMRAMRFGLAAPAKHQAPREQPDTTYAALVERIGRAKLCAGTIEAALGLLGALANAEARIHAVPVDRVHFHELADWDSLLDVVAAGSIAAALHDATWTVSDLPRGGGYVRTQHGRLPVPAPAAAELLKDFRWCDDGVAGERVTPTGAAILRQLVRDPQARPHAGRLSASGTGAGTRELPGMANVLRALVFETDRAEGVQRVTVISFDIDDMTGEEIGVAADKLRATAGVLDVSLGVRWGKKGRPLTAFRLLVDPACLHAVQARCFAETSTIGMRWRFEDRATLRRENVATTAEDGSIVRVKAVTHADGKVARKAESDDVSAADGLRARRARKERAEGGEA